MNTELDNLLEAIDSLPSLPTVAVEVLDLLGQEDVDVAAIADVIQKDPALVVRLLKVANSASFGLSREVSSIRQALVVLGLRTVKIMVLGFSLVETWRHQGEGGFDFQRFWRVTLVKSAAARVLAERLGGASRDEAFVAGLLANIGMLVLHSHLGEEYDEIVDSHSEEEMSLVEMERSQLGVDHAEVGGRLLEFWGLPEIISVPVKGHHDPEQAETPAQDVTDLTRLLHLATITSELIGEEPDEQTTEALAEFLTQKAEEYFSKTARDLSPILEMIREQMREVAEVFSVDIGGAEALDSIRDRAQKTLLNLSMETAQENSALRGENEKLRVRATQDALTGIANRGVMEDRLRTEIARASRLDCSLGFLLMDVDHFKRVNDSHGHDVGDTVLKGVALVLKKSVREVDVVARYGGEEFGVVCPTVTLPGLKKIAERIRRTVEMMKFPLPSGEELRITISIGGVVSEDASQLENSVLIKAADRRLYEAKDGGRNQTRVGRLEEDNS